MFVDPVTPPFALLLCLLSRQRIQVVRHRVAQQGPTKVCVQIDGHRG